MDLTFLISILCWSCVNYLVANHLVNKYPEFNINPIYYAIGGFLLGGIYPLIFLGVKFAMWKNKNK